MDKPKSIKDMTPEEVAKLPMLGLDDTFNFTCKACGKCCKHREDILLTPYDCFRIAAYFGRTPQEIVERYCEVYEGDTSHFPVVRLLPIPPDNSCPFLRNKKCAVHAKKPGVCRVFPLARMFMADGESRYYFNGSGCKHEPKPTSVRDWIADFATDESEEAGQIWRDAVMSIHMLIRPDSLKLSAADRRELIDSIVGALWLAYDTAKPFVPQLKTNFAAIMRVLEVVQNG